MLISTLYHNINADKYSNKYDIFEKHLIYIKNNFNIVVPNDNLKGDDICLTFDDAFFNFYVYVFPLLKKHKIKAILSVPAKFILETTTHQKQDRLNILHDDTYENINKAPFCTFKELQEMVDSGFVIVASHSYSHTNLKTQNNLVDELDKSKDILEKRLGIICDSFVFPFGKYDDIVVKEAKKRYKWLFRIGNGLNRDFDGIDGLIYRINADNLKDKKDIFSFKNMLKYRLKSWLKSTQGKFFAN